MLPPIGPPSEQLFPLFARQPHHLATFFEEGDAQQQHQEQEQQQQHCQQEQEQQMALHQLLQHYAAQQQQGSAVNSNHSLPPVSQGPQHGAFSSNHHHQQQQQLGSQFYNFPGHAHSAATPAPAVVSSELPTPAVEMPHGPAATRASTPGQRVGRSRRMSRARSLPKPTHNPWITEDGEVLDLEEMFGDEGYAAGRPSAGAPAGAPSALSEISSVGEAPVGTPLRPGSGLGPGGQSVEFGACGAAQYGRGGGGGYGGGFFAPRCSSPYASKGPSPLFEGVAAPGSRVGTGPGGYGPNGMQQQHMYGSPYRQGGGEQSGAAQQYQPGMVVEGFMNPFQSPAAVASPFAGPPSEQQVPMHASNSTTANMPMLLALAGAFAASMGLPKVDSTVVTPAASSRAGSRPGSRAASSGTGSPAEFLSPQTSAGAQISPSHVRPASASPPPAADGAGYRHRMHYQQQQGAAGGGFGTAGSPRFVAQSEQQQWQQHGVGVSHYQRPSSRLAVQGGGGDEAHHYHHQQQQQVGAVGVGPLAPSRGRRRSWRAVEEGINNCSSSSMSSGTAAVISPFALAASPFAAVPVQQQGFQGEGGHTREEASWGAACGRGDSASPAGAPQQLGQRFISPFAAAQEFPCANQGVNVAAAAAAGEGTSNHMLFDTEQQQQKWQQPLVSPFAAAQGVEAGPSEEEVVVVRNGSICSSSGSGVLPLAEQPVPPPSAVPASRSFFMSPFAQAQQMPFDD